MSIKKYLYSLTINKIPRIGDINNITNKIKVNYLSKIFGHIGENVDIRSNIKFANGKNIYISHNSGIGERCFLQDLGKIRIGNDVLMAPEVMIYTANHGISKTSLIRLQNNTIKDVVIEDDVWIGSRVTILPGVTIRRGSVIGAGTVVTKDTEPYSIVGGVPGRLIGYRE